ncbi:MAG TPA: TldD/PmbA family protein [Nitrososphaerales archaeon]|nr:TldD/PmbA family protein [Nitrososphaerales archaeon]
MAKMMGPDESNKFGVGVAEKLGTDEAVLMTVISNERMERFANSSVTVTKNVNESGQIVYLAKGGRRIIGSSSNPERSSLGRFIELLFKSMMSLPKDAGYVPLPSRGRAYRPKPSHDRRLESADGILAGYVEEAIGAAEQAGAGRTAGSLEAGVTSHHIMSSTGTIGSDTSSSILLNIRAFTDRDASGHGLSCAAKVRDFRPAVAGERAGEHSKRMRNARQLNEEGKAFQVLMSPTVASNLLGLVGDFASAFSIEAGTSYLVGKLGKKVAAEDFDLTDVGKGDDCLQARTFDDEGQPTQSTKLVERGVLKSYLHNLSTAKRFKAKSTGNAGFIDPGPWNLEIGAGDSTYDEMVKEMKRGLVLTSNWYTRFKNYRTGEFSTVPRDGTYLVESGEVRAPIKGIRISDSLERMSSSIRLLSKEREWVQWWEVDTPTLCPWVLVDGVTVTKAYGESPPKGSQSE